jgi:hypothetical protein
VAAIDEAIQLLAALSKGEVDVSVERTSEPRDGFACEPTDAPVLRLHDGPARDSGTGGHVRLRPVVTKPHGPKCDADALEVHVAQLRRRRLVSRYARRHLTVVV